MILYEIWYDHPRFGKVLAYYENRPDFVLFLQQESEYEFGYPTWITSREL